jgi:sulfur transfer protein SufE
MGGKESNMKKTKKKILWTIPGTPENRLEKKILRARNPEDRQRLLLELGQLQEKYRLEERAKQKAQRKPVVQ